MLTFWLLAMALGITLILVIFFARFMEGYRRALEHQGLTEKRRPRVDEDEAAGVRDLILRGQIDEAVDVYRAFTGVDLYTAQDRIAEMASQIRLGERYDEVRRLVRLGDKAAAIEAYQAATDATLAEALAEVERIQQGA